MVSLVMVSSIVLYYNFPRTEENLLFLEYFKHLPDNINGFTYFNLIAIRDYYNDSIINAMFLLNPNFSVAEAIAVILSSNGTYLVYMNESIYNYDYQCFADEVENSLYNKMYPKVLKLFGNVRRIDVLGYLNDSRTAITGDTYLSVKIEDGIGFAIAVFEEMPSILKYELLEVVGVFYERMDTNSKYYFVYYTNIFSIHIDSGIINNFNSTANCINFFLYGGTINELLETSLRHKIRIYASLAAEKGIDFVYNDIQARNLTYSPIITINSSSGFSERKGNVAPYGIVLEVLKDYNKNYTKLEAYLLQLQQDDLWPYHQGFISTSIDSTLVFGAIMNETSINILKIFMKNSGGFLGQLNDTSSPYSMNSTLKVQFWCQEDYGTTASSYYFLNQIGEANQTTLTYLKSNFEKRSSLWIANPFYIDYLTARVLVNQSDTDDILLNLTKSILSQKNSDGTWGSYDLELSTAFAILALETLNYTGYEVDLARYKLTLMQNSDGSWNSSNLYYWATYLGQNTTSPLNLYINDHYFEYFLCEDIDRIITTSFVLFALRNNSRLYGTTLDYSLTGPLFPSLQEYLSHVLAIYDIY